MPPEEPTTSHELLPALTPDLIVVGRPGRWSIEKLAPHLAERLGAGRDQVRGLTLAGLPVATYPPLGELADEAAGGDEGLQSVHLGIESRRGRERVLVDVQPLGLSEDYQQQRVGFFVHSLIAADREPITCFGLVGASPALAEVIRKIERYGPTDAAVVVTGETGTGKELVARALHQAGSRAQGPFVAVNCTAISEELLESELFGHERGAFTGAVRSHRGRFERAHRGTLFLDEIGDMPLHTQAKLLRVIETGVVERVGAEADLQVDVRIVCATNVVLERAVQAGRFRADLYHRLSVLRIHLPPLRERPEDIPVLVEHFLDEFRAKYGQSVLRLTSEALSILQSYLWPGNVRELRNVLERIFIETRSEVIGTRALAEWVRERQSFAGGDQVASPVQKVAAIAPPYPLDSERRLLSAPQIPEDRPAARLVTPSGPVRLAAEEIREAYRMARGNLAQAARLLGIHRATLYRHLRRLGLSRSDLAD